MEDQGIMALPMGGMQAPTAQPPAQGFDPATAAAFEQMRSQVSPKEFSSEMLSAAEQANPAAVQQLKQALSGIQLPQEVIDAMQQMVEVILRDPQNYPAIRQEMLSDGIPADLLPEQFDPMFFGALRVALDQIEAEAGGQPVQAFAMGGIANLRPIAQAMQGMGRGQDTMLAHINPQEARVLQMMGGIGTINPSTGLREYGFFKSLAKPFKAVGKAISGAVKGVVNGVKDFVKSDIGRIVTTVALGFFLGPAAASFLGVTSAAGVAAVSGFVGGFGSGILGGASLKDSLKAGATGAVLGGVSAGVTGGMGAFDANSYTGATTIAGQYEKAVSMGKDLLGLQPTNVEGLGASADSVGGGGVGSTQINTPTLADQTANLSIEQQELFNQINAPVNTAGAPGVNVASAPVSASGTLTDAGSPFARSIQNLPLPDDFVRSGIPVDAQELAFTIGNPHAGVPPAYTNYIPGTPAEAALRIAPPSNVPYNLTSDYMNLVDPAQVGGGAPLPADVVYKDTLAAQATRPGVMNQLSSGDYTGAAKTAYQNTVDFFNPNSGMPGPTAIEDRALALQQKFPGLSSEAALKQAATDVAQNTPGMISRYAPITGAALGAAYLGGAFTPEEPGSPNLAPKETGTDLLRAQPGVYGTTPGGANVTYASLPSGYNYNPMQMLYRPQVTMGNPYGNIYGQRRMFAEGGIAAVAPAKYNLGGYASGGIGSMAKKYPRRTGQISGPGTGTSDDIPAMLSDGEFVMTAKAVRGAGKGSRREGAKRMYAMMRKLEGKA
jgi:hypothetical protein